MDPCTVNVASEEYADFILRHGNLPLESLADEYNTPCLDYVNREYAIIYSPLSQAEPLTIEKHSYTSIPSLYTLLDKTSMEASGIIPVFNQPVLNVRGQGTIIGFIDTGIDYQNPIFRKPDGSTRILGIWDQNLPDPKLSSDQPPGIYPIYPNARILYGTEFSETEINQALQSQNPLELVPSSDENGHGTFMAGIAAGGESPTADFIGAAPECNIAVVKLKPAKGYLRDFYLIRDDAIAFQENDIMMGIKYLLTLAFTYKMPLTIYLGLGTNQGSHDGTSPLSLQLRDLSRLLGVVTVIAAGNEAGLSHHYLGKMVQNQEYEDVEVRVGSGERGFVIEMWAREPELYTVGFVSPTGEVVQRIPIATGSETRVRFLLEATVITVNYRNSEIGSGSQLIFMRFETPTEGIWRVRVYNSIFITGEYHMWLPVDGFISENTVFLKPNPFTTITDPGNTQSPITVSTYNHRNGSIYIHSSRGYSRSGIIKPELAGPGVEVYGPGLPRLKLPSDSSDYYPYTKKTGSSVAAAHVAGAVADLLSWGIVRGNNKAMSDVAVKSYLIRGAKRSPSYTYPNEEWGYGALDLYQTFLSLRE